MLSVEQVNDIITEATLAAQLAADKYFKENLNGQDNYPCGFSSILLYKHDGIKITKKSKIGKILSSFGLSQDYSSNAFYIYNPGSYRGQNIDAKEAGSRAAASVFESYGFSVSVSSRLD